MTVLKFDYDVKMTITCKSSSSNETFTFVGNCKGPGKRGHIVADTLLPMMFLGLRKLGNIFSEHKIGRAHV